jgi:hypothetical protein
MLGEWINFSGLRSSCVSLVLIGGLGSGAAQADPLYLPTPKGTERFGRRALRPT